MRSRYRLSMSCVQENVNHSFGPNTSNAYGSLFEFLDGKNFVINQVKQTKNRLLDMENQIAQKIKQSNQGSVKL